MFSLKKMSRKCFAIAFLTAPMLSAAFPTKPVSILVPYAPGSSLDAVGRTIAEVLSKQWGQPVVIENKPGANGLLATNQLMKSRPDGYTILYHLTGMIQNPLVNRNAKYDPLVDVKPVIMIGTQGTGLATSMQSPFNSVSELIDYYKQHPGEATYASAGVGQTGHIYSELLASENGVKVEHAPYNGPAAIAVDLMEGRVAWSFVSAADASRFGQEGRLKILGVTGPDRIDAISDVKTMEEQGYRGFEMTGWHGLFVPSNTPDAVVKQISDAVQKALEDEKVKDVMKNYVIKGTTLDSAPFKDLMESDMAKWKKLVERYNIIVN